MAAEQRQRLLLRSLDWARCIDMKHARHFIGFDERGAQLGPQLQACIRDNAFFSGAPVRPTKDRLVEVLVPVGGDVLALVMRAEQIGFREAVDRLAETYLSPPVAVRRPPPRPAPSGLEEPIAPPLLGEPGALTLSDRACLGIGLTKRTPIRASGTDPTHGSACPRRGHLPPG